MGHETDADTANNTANETASERDSDRDDTVIDDESWQDDEDEMSPDTSALLGASRGYDLDDELCSDPPLYWPEIAADDAGAEWEDLRFWVTRLVARFDLDVRTLPVCWYEHNAHVEALVALRDHERACYSAHAPATAGIEWHRALRDVEQRLREWTARSGCLSVHRPRSELAIEEPLGSWRDLVERDVSARRERVVADLLGDATVQRTRGSAC